MQASFNLEIFIPVVTKYYKYVVKVKLKTKSEWHFKVGPVSTVYA